MKKHIDFTDAEVYELEKLSIEKFHNLELKPIEYNSKENTVIIKNPEFESLVNFYYEGRYSKEDNGNIKMSLFIFRLLQYRFFNNNQTLSIVDSALDKELACLIAEEHILSMCYQSLKFEVDDKILNILKDKDIIIRIDSNKNYHNDLRKVKMKIKEIKSKINSLKN